MTQTTAGAGDTPAKLFRGYDSISAGMMNESAVTGGSEQGGGRSTVHIQVCESVSELAQALEIDASLSVSYLKAVNVTAKMNFMKKLNATARSVTIVVYASHETGTWMAKDVKLAQGVTAPADDEAAADFVDSYGDSYVSAATQGGEYYAVYTFRTETQTEQKELTASLKAKGVYSGVTAKADVQLKLSDFLKTTSTNWTFDQEITGIANPDLPDQEKLIEFALAFPKKQLDSPVTTGFKVTGYESVPGIGRRKFGKIMDNRDHFLGTEGVLHDFVRLKTIENQIAWLKRIYARYKYTGDKALLDFENDVRADRGKIDKQISEYKRNPARDFVRPSLPSLNKGEPVLTFTPGQPASFGSEGGGDFKFMSVGDALRNQVRIASLQLADDNKLIRRLIVGYASEKANWTAFYGADGATREMFYIEDGQFLSRIAGRASAYVDRLEFYLPDGRHTWAGGSGGSAFDWITPAGSVVLGFAGRCGLNLDQLKIIHAKLEPAQYVQPVL